MLSRAAAGVTCAAAGGLHAGGQVHVRSGAERCYGNSLASAAPLTSLASAAGPRRSRWVLEPGPLVSPEPWAPSRPEPSVGPGGAGRFGLLRAGPGRGAAAGAAGVPVLTVRSLLQPPGRRGPAWRSGSSRRCETTSASRPMATRPSRSGTCCQVGAEPGRAAGWVPSGGGRGRAFPTANPLPLPERRLHPPPAPCFPSLTALQLQRCPPC